MKSLIIIIMLIAGISYSEPLPNLSVDDGDLLHEYITGWTYMSEYDRARLYLWYMYDIDVFEYRISDYRNDFVFHVKASYNKKNTGNTYIYTKTNSILSDSKQVKYSRILQKSTAFKNYFPFYQSDIYCGFRI